MKSFIWTLGGVCAAATGFLLWRHSRIPQVELLAHQLDQAWSDHNTHA